MNGFVLEAPIGISARHVHLSPDHVRILFGTDLSVDRYLTQTGEFAAHQRVTLVTAHGSIPNVRVLGPTRSQTQVEISRTDAFALDCDAPVRLSGNLAGTPNICLVGSKGSVQAESGVIVASRHLHISELEANRHQLKTGMIVKAELHGERAMTFDQITVRAGSKAVLELHLDTDEANAAGAKTGDIARIIKPLKATVSTSARFICVEDIINLSSGSIRLESHQKITPDALELARKKGIIIS